MWWSKQMNDYKRNRARSMAKWFKKNAWMKLQAFAHRQTCMYYVFFVFQSHRKMPTTLPTMFMWCIDCHIIFQTIFTFIKLNSFCANLNWSSSQSHSVEFNHSFFFSFSLSLYFSHINLWGKKLPRLFLLLDWISWLRFEGEQK